MNACLMKAYAPELSVMFYCKILDILLVFNIRLKIVLFSWNTCFLYWTKPAWFQYLMSHMDADNFNFENFGKSYLITVSFLGFFYFREMTHPVCVSSYYQLSAKILHLGILVCRQVFICPVIYWYTISSSNLTVFYYCYLDAR